jgi:hypothetical protein
LVIVTNTNDDGPGSLRAAITAGSVLISFTNTLAGQTILLTNGQLTLSNSTSIDASGLGNGVIIDAGNASRALEIIASNSVELDSLTITNGNTSNDGGGILANDGVNLTLNNCTVAGNSAGAGGGIAQFSGALTANNSTLSGNTTTQNGGALDIAGGQSTLNNCTLFGNFARTNGGGIFVDAGVTNMLNNCTVAGNSAGTGGGVFQNSSSVSMLVNTIVAGNTAANSPDIFGLFTGTNNFMDGDARLAPLGNYGGPTKTMPPMFGSPAIDAGLDSVTNALPTDQRGYARLVGPHVDIGAVEAQKPPTNQRPAVKLSRVSPGGAWNLAFTSITNGDFTILSSTNLRLPLIQWEILGRPIQNLPGSYQFTDSASTNRTRFYQVVSP